LFHAEKSLLKGIAAIGESAVALNRFDIFDLKEWKSQSRCIASTGFHPRRGGK